MREASVAKQRRFSSHLEVFPPGNGAAVIGLREPDEDLDQFPPARALDEMARIPFFSSVAPG